MSNLKHRTITINDTSFTCNFTPTAEHDVRWRWSGTGPQASDAPDAGYATFGAARGALYTAMGASSALMRRVRITKALAEAIQLHVTAPNRGIIMERISDTAYRVVAPDHTLLDIANQIEALGGKQNKRSADRIRTLSSEDSQ